MSLWHTAQARTRTAISPSAGRAMETSSIASCWPKARQTAARKAILLQMQRKIPRPASIVKRMQRVEPCGGQLTARSSLAQLDGRDVSAVNLTVSDVRQLHYPSD